MARRTPRLRIPPGPLTRASAEVINESLEYLHAFVGDVTPAPPLEGSWDRGGLTIRVNTRALAQLLGSSAYPVTIDTSSFSTSNPTWTWTQASSTWTWTYTTQLTLSLTGGPLIIQAGSGTTPLELFVALYYVETKDTFAARKDNYALPWNTATLSVDLTGSQSLTGMQAGTIPSGLERIVFVVNRNNSSTLTLTHLDANSSAANQFSLPGGTSYVLNPGEGVSLEYSGVDSVWRCQDKGAPTAADITAAGGATTDNATGSGTTTDAFATVWDRPASPAAPTGVHGGFTLKNTGVTNTLKYRITVKDMYGTSTSTAGTATLAPGQIFANGVDDLKDVTGLAGTFCPYQEVKLEVAANAAGNQTTYTWYRSFVG